MNIRRSILAMGLAALTACLPLFGTTGAMLSPMAGTVAVNGQTVAAGSAIMPGDLVSTSAQGSARMVLPGGSLIAASNTNFRMESLNNASAVRLNSGLVEVTGSLPVQLNTSTVMPANAQTRFNVYALSGKVYVETLKGSVAVKFAKSTTTVAAGNSASYADPAAGAAQGAAADMSDGGSSAGVIMGAVGLGLGVIGLAVAIHAKNRANTACASASPAC